MPPDLVVPAIALVVRGPVHCTLKQLEITGTFCQKPFVTPRLGNCEPLPDVVFSPVKCDWDSESRTQTVKFEDTREVQYLRVRVKPGLSAISLIILYQQRQVVMESHHILLPEVSQEAVLTFVDTSPPCNVVRLFYLDRIPVATPHEIMFG
jgi:hypothetical protein